MKAALLGAAFFIVRGVAAGEQLSTASLVKESEAVVVVDNTLDRKGTVKAWLRGTDALAGKLGPLAGVCVPDRAILQQWLATHPKHSGRDTWKKSIAVGHVEQVVFLATRDGVLVPTCETEVMLGRSFSLHPEYPAFRAELDTLLAPPPSPTVPPPTVPPPTVPPPTVPADAPSSPPPPSSSGCL